MLARLSGRGACIDLPTEGGRIFRVRTDSVIRIYSQNRRNFVCVEGETIRTSASMNELASWLASDEFLRISRFEIVNLKKVERFDFSIAGELKISLEDDQIVYASRRYIPVIREYLKRGDES